MKKKELEELCVFSECVLCSPSGRECEKCGWNPIVSEIRVFALKNGERRFLRYTNRDYDAVIPSEHKIRK